MSLVRTGSLVLVVSASLLTVACGASSSAEDSSALTPAKQGETSSELVLSKVDNAASVEIASDDGACTEVPTLVEANKDKLKSLCAQGQIPVPVQADTDGCTEGSAIKVTFTCLAVNMPPIPHDQCVAFSVKDNGAMAQGMALDPQLVCAPIGGAPPPFAGGGMQGQPNGAQPNAQPGQPGQPGGQPGFPQAPGGQPGQPGGQPGQQCNGPMPPPGGVPGGAQGGPQGGAPGGAQGGQSPFPPGPPAIRCCAPTNGQ